MGLIYHIAAAADWTEALANGEYRMSTRGRTLQDVGFIHCSRADQVETVSRAIYHDARDLVLLAIDPNRVRPEIRYERPSGSGELFPHIYGPLNLDAVVRVTPFEPGGEPC